MMTLLLAIWGAFLSTLLGIRVLHSEFPRPLLSKASDDKIILSFRNGAKHAIFLHRIGCYGNVLRFVSHSPSTRAAVQTAINETLHSDLQIVLASDAKIDFDVQETRAFKLALLIFYWSSARLSLLPKIPVVVVVSKRKLEALKRSSSGEPGPEQMIG